MPGARPHSSNLPRSALSATRNCSAKPLKHRAAFQLLRTSAVAASALQLRAPSLRQLPRCAAAHTTWPKEKKTRRPGSAAGRTKVRPQTKNKTRRQPLIRAPAHLRARWVLGHEDCMARRAATGKDAARKEETKRRRHRTSRRYRPVLYLFPA